jgi:hypothetical protein
METGSSKSFFVTKATEEKKDNGKEETMRLETWSPHSAFDSAFTSSGFSVGSLSHRKTVNNWTIEDVFNWTKDLLGKENEDIGKILKNQRVNGSALLTLTKENLKSIRIPLGPAANLEKAIEQLKDPRGIA